MTGQEHILIVEDSPTQAEKLRQLLEKQRYHVTDKPDGRAALDFLVNHEPDLILSDVVMPGMDGFELCRRIKHDERLKHLPVMLLTSLSRPDEIIQGLEARCDNFVLKPYDDAKLIVGIRNLLEKAEKPEGGSAPPANRGIPLRFGGHVHFIDSDHQQILSLLVSVLEATYQECQELRNRSGSTPEAKYLRQALLDLAAVHTDGVLVVDLNEVVLYANPAAAAFFGLPPAELTGQALDMQLAVDEERNVEIPAPDGSSTPGTLKVRRLVWDGQESMLLTLHRL